VDDGSSAARRERPRSLAKSARGRVKVLALGANLGRAEAVRRDVRETLAGEPVVYEYPVESCVEISGSKRRSGAHLRAALALIRIRHRHLRRAPSVASPRR
jgi:hypothetical protein